MLLLWAGYREEVSITGRRRLSGLPSLNSLYEYYYASGIIESEELHRPEPPPGAVVIRVDDVFRRLLDAAGLDWTQRKIYAVVDDRGRCTNLHCISVG